MMDPERRAIVREWRLATGGKSPDRQRLRALEAVDRLVTPYAAETAAERRRAAVVLLANAAALDAAALRDALGEALGYVRLVAQVLHEEARIQPAL